MQMARCKVILLSLLLCLIAVASASAHASGKSDYLADCARCHAVDGKGRVPEMREVKGYMSVDLTQLSKANGGQFPRQAVYDAIDGRKRFPLHFVGDMPAWGVQYQEKDQELTAEGREKVKRRIAALVGYIESLQEK